MPRGGARPNSGPKKGSRQKGTLEKEAAREAYRAAVAEHMEAIIRAQIEQAVGLRCMVARDRRTGKFRGRIRSAAQLDRAMKDDSLDIVEVWIKEPNPQAATDILNRYLDKPKEQEVAVMHKDAERIVQRLHAGRARVAEAAKHGMRLVPGRQRET